MRNNNWFRAEIQETGPVKLWLYGEIVGSDGEKWGYDDVCPSDVAKALEQANGRDLDIYINSPGGDVFAGLAICARLSQYPGKKTAHVDGVAASIASVIPMVCDEVFIPENAYLMVHKAWCIARGNADDLRKTVEMLDKADGSIRNFYLQKLNPDKEEELSNRIEAESWMDGKETVGFFPSFQLESPVKLAACADLKEVCGRQGWKVPEGYAEPTEDAELLKESLLLEMEL